MPEPPVPLIGMRRGTLVDAIGPTTGWGTGAVTLDRIGDSIGLPFSSSGVMR